LMILYKRREEGYFVTYSGYDLFDLKFNFF